MIHCKELNTDFETIEDLHKALVENEAVIIDRKKSVIYKSIEKGLQVVTDQKSIEKALDTEANKGIKFDDAYYYFVVNSANYLDSHLDMHASGNWNKSVKDQQGKCYLVFDHALEKSEIIAMKKDIEMFTANISWKMLGKDYDGETYCLIYKVAKNKIIHKQAKEWLEQGYDFEASVRMQYVKIEIAFKSNNPEYAKQNATYEEYYPLIANKEALDDVEVFWIVKEAKNVYESSLVLFGSNDATGMINNENKSEAVEDTTESEEPSDDTQTIEVKRKLSVI